MKANKTFSNWLIEERLRMGVSEKRVADLAGISLSKFSRVVKGRIKPTRGLCEGIAKAFKMPIEEVLSVAGLLPHQRRSIKRLADIYCWITNLNGDDLKDFDRYIRFV